jgi:uncharacterized protein
MRLLQNSPQIDLMLNRPLHTNLIEDNFMTKTLWLIFLCLCATTQASAQQMSFPAPAATDEVELSKAMPALAKEVIANYKDDDRERYLSNLFRLQMIAEQYSEANATIKSLREILKANDPVYGNVTFKQYEIFSNAKLIQATRNISFEEAFTQSFREGYRKLSDKEAFRVSGSFVFNLDSARADLQKFLEQQKEKSSISLIDALALARRYQPYLVFKSILPLTESLRSEDDHRRYTIQDDVLIKTKDGATLSAAVVQKKGVTTRQPAALFFNIYTDLGLNQAKQAAAHGYVGVAADTRGKRRSPDEIVPYEHEVNDTYAVIDWISKQSWSDGKVGMYGGSYSGYTAWAATKHLHPALKTIVPSVAIIPGLGLPMENNVFLLANYGWVFYVTNNKYLDNKTYFDPDRWESMRNKWYASGRPFREVDSVDGAPNKLLQRWLQHPSYDKYWQDMVPYQNDYSRINIPVLSITGYYDDAQISALHYVKEHYKYNKNANHYLLIGPYSHFGAQASRKPPVINGYTIDPVAQFDTPEITFQWFDYVMRGGKKPELLKDKINYQVMGSNIWKHASSLEKMSNAVLTLYLSNMKSGDHYQLTAKKPGKPGFLSQEVDFADRKTENLDYYPDPIIKDKLDLSGSLSFISEPFDEPVSVDGTFTGELKASINKRDMDISLVFYEVMPDGKYFHLTYFLGRASYARDMSIRKLLTPGKVESIPFDRIRMVSRQLKKGSRLLVVLTINKNSFAQINYGIGKDVSDETIADAKTPLQIKWYNDSYVKIPIWK